jgi:hypothetical protein
VTYLPEVRDALASSISTRAERPTLSGLRRLRSVVVAKAIPALLVLSSLLIALFVLVNLDGASHRTTPAAGDRVASGVPSVWLRDNQRAIGLVAIRDRRCAITINTRRPRHQHLLFGQPSSRLVALLAVLRHPAPAAARVSAAQIRRLDVGAQGIYIRYARHGTVDGIDWYLIPVAHIQPNQLPARCFVQRLAAFTELAARLPAANRARAISWERSRIRAERGPAPGGIVLMNVGGGSTGASFRTVESLRDMPWMGGGGGSDNITKTLLLVPNSVESVTARYGQQTYPGRVRTPVTVTKRAVGNLVVFVFRGAWDPPALTYRSASGNVVWSTPRRG